MLPLLCPTITMAATPIEGFYIGAKAGGEVFSGTMEGTQLSMTKASLTGANYGGYIGYQLPLNHQVSISVEGEYMHHSTRLKYAIANNPEQRLELDKSGSGSVRLSFEAYEYVDFFVFGGVTKGRINYENGQSARQHDDLSGKMGGVGFEFMNESPMRFRVEYRHTKYDDVKLLAQSNTKYSPRSNALSIGAQFVF